MVFIFNGNNEAVTASERALCVRDRKGGEAGAVSRTERSEPLEEPDDAQRWNAQKKCNYIWILILKCRTEKVGKYEVKNQDTPRNVAEKVTIYFELYRLMLPDQND